MKKMLLLLLSFLMAGSLTVADAAVVRKDAKATLTTQNKKTTASQKQTKAAKKQTGKKKTMAVANAPAKKPTKAKKR